MIVVIYHGHKVHSANVCLIPNRSIWEGPLACDTKSRCDWKQSWIGLGEGNYEWWKTVLGYRQQGSRNKDMMRGEKRMGIGKQERLWQ